MNHTDVSLRIFNRFAHRQTSFTACNPFSIGIQYDLRKIMSCPISSNTLSYHACNCVLQSMHSVTLFFHGLMCLFVDRNLPPNSSLEAIITFASITWSCCTKRFKTKELLDFGPAGPIIVRARAISFFAALITFDWGLTAIFDFCLTHPWRKKVYRLGLLSNESASRGFFRDLSCF